MRIKDLLTSRVFLIITVVVIVVLLGLCVRGMFPKESFDPNTTTMDELRTESMEQKLNMSKTDMEDKNVKSNGKDANKLDPISNPRYNMQQVVKQSILLEEHLNNRRKRCRDCITKHFNHIIGLCEEAVMLSTNKPNDYCPHLKDSVELYNDIFKEWLDCYKKKQEHNEECMKRICDKLRSQRKKLITCYFFENDNTALNYKDTYTNEEHLREHMTLENPLNIPMGYTTVIGSQY